MPLTLFVPHLLPPSDAPGDMRSLRLPSLEKWLARGRASREPGSGMAWLLRQWGLPPDAPVAALTLAADGGPRDGTWLRADPVHQRVARNSLVLHDAAALALAPEETALALETLNDFFGTDGLEFVAPNAERWYVRVPPGEVPATTPLDEAVGRNPFGMLPSEGGRLKWRSIFSEAQMLLAALPFNAEREARGQPALNGVWFWGGGERPPALPRPFASVAATEALARSLALASDCPVQSLPAGIAQLPARGTGECLAVIDAMRAPLRAGDAVAWIDAARALDRDWFAGIGDALAAFGRVRIVLPSERDVAVFDVSPGARWKLFRRTAPFATHA